MPIVNLIVLVGLAYLIVVQTLTGWLSSVRKGESVSLFPARGGRAWPLWAQVAFMLLGVLIAIPLVYLLWVPLPSAVSPAAVPLLVAIGMALFLAGVGLTVWGRRALGANWGVSTSREVKLLPDHHLIQTGPYAYVRHPMYLGWWLSLVGLILIYWTWLPLVLLVMSLASFYKRARLEEKVLADRFGVEWEAYAARSGFMIPWFRGRGEPGR